MVRQQPAVPPERNRGERDQRAESGTRSAARCRRHGRSTRALRSRSRGRGGAPQTKSCASGCSSPNAAVTPTTSVNHMRVKMSWTTGNHVIRLTNGVQVVTGLPRDRHLPVVEPVVGPVRHDEERKDQGATDGQGQQRHAARSPCRPRVDLPATSNQAISCLDAPARQRRMRPTPW